MIKRIVGANERKLTTKELEFAAKWQTELKATHEQIKASYEITIDKTGKLSFSYMNKVLEGLISGKSTKKTPEKKSRYDYSELERKAFLNISKGGVGNGV